MKCPKNTTAWFTKMHQQITNIDLGAHYSAVIAAWTQMEKTLCFEEGLDKLPVKGCPPSITAWIQSNGVFLGIAAVI
jgi:hypothetical protein